ncbi:MAG: hypothetical protein AMXMBFR33_17540 [Candidatus Xenobia bacterium]
MILGVDFGTTHSSITYCDEGMTDAEAVPITPDFDVPYNTIMRTAAFVAPTGEVIVHDWNQVVNRPDFEQGVGLKNFKPYLNRWTLKTIEMMPRTRQVWDEHLETWKDVSDGAEAIPINPPYSYKDVLQGTTEVFRRLVKGLRELGKDPSRATTILLGNPVRFQGFARRRLMRAAIAAGLVENGKDAFERLRFVYEPVAAACACGKLTFARRSVEAKTALVFDYGGGTLDLALIRFENDKGVLQPTEVLATDVIPCAGHHIDHIILDHLCEVEPGLAEETVRRGSDGFWRVMQLVELAKHELSTRETHTMIYGPGKSISITQDQLNAILAPLTSRIRARINRLLKSVEAQPDVVVTAGGSSLMPAIQNMLKERFQDKEVEVYDPALREKKGPVEQALTAVSRGLSLYGLRRGLREITDRRFFIVDSKDELVTVLDRGTRFSVEGVATGGPVEPVSLPVNAKSATLCLYEDGLGGPEPLLQLVDFPVTGENGAQIECILRKGAFAPDLAIDGRLLQLTGRSDKEYRDLLSSDEGIVRLGAKPDSPRVCQHRIGRGDQVVAGTDLNGGSEVEGVISMVRFITDTEDLQVRETASPDLRQYLFRVLKEGCVTTSAFRTTRPKMRVRQKAERYRNTNQDNLFRDQINRFLEETIDDSDETDEN